MQYRAMLRFLIREQGNFFGHQKTVDLVIFGGVLLPFQVSPHIGTAPHTHSENMPQMTCVTKGRRNLCYTYYTREKCYEAKHAIGKSISTSCPK